MEDDSFVRTRRNPFVPTDERPRTSKSRYTRWLYAVFGGLLVLFVVKPFEGIMHAAGERIIEASPHLQELCDYVARRIESAAYEIDPKEKKAAPTDSKLWDEQCTNEVMSKISHGLLAFNDAKAACLGERRSHAAL